MGEQLPTSERGMRPGPATKADRPRRPAGAGRHVHDFMPGRRLMEIGTTGTCDARFRTPRRRLTILIRGTPWPRAYPVAVLRMPPRRLAADMARHRKDPADRSMPGKKNKRTSPCSFTVPARRPRWNGDSLFIAETGTWRVKGPPVPGEVRERAIEFRLGERRAFARTAVDRPPREKTGKTAGVDRNASNIAFHDGDAGAVVEPPARLAALWERARRRRRAPSRLWSIRRKGAEARAQGWDKPRNPRPSKRVLRMRDAFRRDLRTIRRIMHDRRRSIAAEPARKRDVVVLEDLNLKALTGGARERAVSRGMREVGRGRMERMFEGKADAAIKAPAAYAGRRRAGRRQTEPGNRRGNGFKRRRGGHRDRADPNAASNARTSGTEATGSGSGGPGPPAVDPPMDAEEGAAAQAGCVF